MATQIKDGTGSGNSVKVTSTNRMLVDAITEERAVFNSVVDGKTFIVSTDYLTVTGSTGVDYGLLYIKNNSDLVMNIHHIKLWSSLSGQFTKVNVYRNPTGGTLISGANAAQISNLNFASAETFEGLAYEGTGGNLTVTGGEILGKHYMGIGNQQMLAFMWNGALSMPKGSSLAVAIEPPNSVGNTVTCEVEAYFEEI